MGHLKKEMQLANVDKIDAKERNRAKYIRERNRELERKKREEEMKTRLEASRRQNLSQIKPNESQD